MHGGSGVVVCRIGWVVVVLSSLVPAFAAGATGDASVSDTVVRLESRLSEEVVSTGDVMRLRITAYVTTPREESAYRFEEAFLEGALDSSATVALLRERGVHRMREAAQQDSLWIYRRTFLVYGREQGTFNTPVFRMEWEGSERSTPPHELTVYQLDPSFAERQRSILPVLAEVRSEKSSRVFRRWGTGFLVAPDAFLTSLHVLLGARNYFVQLPGGEQVEILDVWAVDPVRDLALLAIDPEAVRRARLEPLMFAPLLRDAPPEALFTNGWPGGTRRPSVGHLIASREENGALRWLTSNPVRPGDSGGPLLTESGRVLGVIVSGTPVGDRADVLREEVAMAVDPRPLLSRRHARQRLDRALRTLERQRDDAFLARMLIAARALPEVLADHRPERLAHLESKMEEPVDAEVGMLAASAFYAYNRTRQVRRIYERLLEERGDSSRVAYLLGVFEYQEGAYDRAGELFEAARRYPPYDQLASFALAMVRQRQLRYAEARELLEEVVHGKPAFAPAYFQLGRCLLAEGREAEARQLLVPLEVVHAGWRHLLAQMIEHPALRPVVPLRVPPVTMRFDSASRMP